MSADAGPIVSEIVAELERAWNTADGDGFARPFTADADFVTIRGEHMRTREVIGRGHQGIFDTIYKGSVARLEVAGARALAPTVILGHVRATLSAPSGPLAGEHNALFTLVLVERQGSWQIAAFHNGLVARAGR
jgi:uncharacterized protein (TIGR02246 family)